MPLEPEVMEALERTHPDLSFDWTSLQKDARSPGRTDAPEPAADGPRGYRGVRAAASAGAGARRRPRRRRSCRVRRHRCSAGRSARPRRRGSGSATASCSNGSRGGRGPRRSGTG